MKLQKQQLITRLEEVFLNGTWIANTNYKNELINTSWLEAITSIKGMNSIAALTFHINYYINGVADVLEGKPLTIKDQYSFDLPPIHTEKEWRNLVETFLSNAKRFITLTQALPYQKLNETFVKPQYGNYARNIEGIIEHSYYHLGQIVLIKKMLQKNL